MIEAADVHKSYGSLEVLKGVSLTVCRGEVVCIVGGERCGQDYAAPDTRYAQCGRQRSYTHRRYSGSKGSPTGNSPIFATAG